MRRWISLISWGIPIVKTHIQIYIDVEDCRLQNKNRLDDCVFVAVNDENYYLGRVFLVLINTASIDFRTLANVLNFPPEE